MAKSPILRRNFLGTAAGLTLGLSAGARLDGSPLTGTPLTGSVPASQRVTIGVVGLGSRGTQVMKDFAGLANVQVIALCDVHPFHHRDRPWGQGTALGSRPAREYLETRYRQDKKSGQGEFVQIYADYRQVLERDDIDAVIVATPDHWHARIAVDAIRAGKDVYCEKPVTHYFSEGRWLADEVRKHKAVFQVGSQQRSDARFRRAVQVVRNGNLGPIRRVEVGLPPGYDEALDDTSPQEPPKELDYDMWCGPAAKLPYMRARHHRWWRSTRAFGGGVLMDWIGHHNDIAHWGVGQDLGGPESVEAAGWSRATCPLYDTPKDYEIRCRYPGDIEWIISSQLEQGTKWIGEDGWLWVTRGKYRASNDQWMSRDYDRGPWQPHESNHHAADFIRGVQERSSCVTSAEIGHRSITPGHLGYVSHALGRRLDWDAATQTVVGDAAAQQLLEECPYRPPWTMD